MYDLGRATGYIRINASDALAAYGKTRAAHSATMSALERSAMTTKRIGLAFGTVGGAALAGFGLAVKATADFQKRLSFLQAVTKATPAQMDRVRDSAFKLGQQFGISANDVADAYVELGKAGVTIPQLTHGVAKATIELARAADTSASEAATTIVNITSSFHLAASQATQVADILAGAANASTVDITDMAYSMKYAGATAHAMGVPLRSMADALALLGNNGIRGSTAGTSLRRMLIQLTGPTDTSRAALEKLGIITKDGANQFFDAHGKMRDLAQVSQILQQATKGLSREQKAQAFNTIFGARALASALILTKAGAKGFAAMHKQVGRTGAYEVARKRLNNLAGAIDKFKAALNVAMIQAGAPAQKPLIQLVHWLTRLVKWFGNLPASTQQTIVRFVLFTGIVFTLAGAFALLTSFIFRLWQTFRLIREMRDAFMGMRIVAKIIYEIRFAMLALSESIFGAEGLLAAVPGIGWVILAVIALGTAAVILYKKWKPFRDLVNSVGRAFVWLGKAIVGGLKSALDWVKSHGAIIAALMMVILLPIAPIIAGIYELLHHWRGVWTAIKVIVGIFVAYWKLQWRILVTVVKAVWTFIGPYVKLQIGILVAAVRFGMNLVKTWFHTAWALAKGYVITAWHVIKNTVMVGVHVIQNLVKIVADILDGHWRRAWNDAQHLVGQAFHDIGHVITQFFSDAGHMLYAAGKALVVGFKNGIVGAAKGLYHVVKSYLVDAPLNLVKKGLGIGSPSRMMIELGSAVGQGFAAGIFGSYGAIRKAVTGIVGLVYKATRQVVASVNTMIAAANKAYSDPYIRATSTKLARLTGEADQRGLFTTVPEAQKAGKKNKFSYNMPKLDLSGADLSGVGGGDGTSKKKKAAAKQKRVDLQLLFQSGQWIMDGFRKGMERGAKGVKDFMKGLQHRILSYYNKAKTYGDKAGMRRLAQLEKQVTRYGNHLFRLAQHRDAVIKKIEHQQKRLDKLMTAKADYAKSVRDSIVALGEIDAVVTKTDALGNVDVTAENIVQGLQTTVDAVKEYDKELDQLLKMGLSKKVYDQLVQEGPEAGGAYARALLDGGKATIDQVNALEAQLDKEAIKMGEKTASVMKDAGIKASQGIIEGLQHDKNKIAAIMREVAHEMVKTLRKELGIKSPSAVMKKMGGFTARGYAMGILAEAHRVRKAAKSLGLAALPDSRSLDARGAGLSPASLRVSATLPDDFKRPDVQVTQNIRSIEPRLAANESARKMRTLAQMGAFG